MRNFAFNTVMVLISISVIAGKPATGFQNIGFKHFHISTEIKEFPNSVFTNYTTNENSYLVFDPGLTQTWISVSYVSVEKPTVMTSSGEIRSGNIRVFLNPAQDYLRITNIGSYKSLSWYDANDRKYGSKKIHPSEYKMKIREYHSELYILRPENGSQQSSFKIFLYPIKT